jgi:hypothetical protein
LLPGPCDSRAEKKEKEIKGKRNKRKKREISYIIALVPLLALISNCLALGHVSFLIITITHFLPVSFCFFPSSSISTLSLPLPNLPPSIVLFLSQSD